MLLLCILSVNCAFYRLNPRSFASASLGLWTDALNHHTLSRRFLPPKPEVGSAGRRVRERTKSSGTASDGVAMVFFALSTTRESDPCALACRSRLLVPHHHDVGDGDAPAAVVTEAYNMTADGTGGRQPRG